VVGTVKKAATDVFVLGELLAMPRSRSVYLLDDHEVVRRGLRQLLEADGLTIVGESGSAREATRQIPALRPDLVILDDSLPDGSGGAVCRALAAAHPSFRCLLLTDGAEEGVLIESILAGAWGCLSKLDDCAELLRLIRRGLRGDTAYSRRFQAVLLSTRPEPEPQLREERLLSLTRQEMNAVIGLGKGLTNRQIGQEMSLAEKTVKNLVSAALMKLGMARRTQAAVLVNVALKRTESPAGGGYRFSLSQDLVAEVVAALRNCTSETGPRPVLEALRARNAGRLASALDATRTVRTLTPRPANGIPGN
jgi:two-component system response regulator DevR